MGFERERAKRTEVVPALAIALIVGAGAGACGSGGASPEERTKAGVKINIDNELGNLTSAVAALRAAAPEPDADGWSAEADPDAVAAMRTSWRQSRMAWERIEGAIAVLFPSYDESLDQRYDGFLADHGPDSDLFDGEGVTGVHAVERILWADSAPAQVVTFEMGLTGYVPATFPMDAAQAGEFKDGLCKRLVDDTTAVQQMFVPRSLDTTAAFRGVIDSMNEQIEKIELAATGEEESRYAQHTLADMRSNLEGGRNTYAPFRAWLKGKAGGAALDADILAGFARMSALYGMFVDSLPPVPVGFDPQAPAAADLETPFGTIFAGLKHESDPADPASLVSKLTAAADLLGIPQLAP